MSEAVIPHVERGLHAEHEVGFIRHYVFSTEDRKSVV